ncbi:MAG: ANTAR domain-containing protein [Acidimicrobiales bacterium]
MSRHIKARVASGAPAQPSLPADPDLDSAPRHAFGEREQQPAAVFATEASNILADAGVDIPDDQVAARMAEALTARETIAQAQGAIMQRDGVSADDTYALLRRYSVRANSSLRERAAEVVARTRRGRGQPPSR